MNAVSTRMEGMSGDFRTPQNPKTPFQIKRMIIILFCLKTIKLITTCPPLHQLALLSSPLVLILDQTRLAV